MSASLRKQYPGIPRSFVVDGRTVTIDVAQLGMVDGYPKSGDHSEDAIRIAPDMTRKLARGTLLHELLHNLWERGGLNKKYSDRTEEWIIATIDAWLFKVFEDNPELVDYLTGRD